MTKEELIFILDLAANTSSHQGTGADALASAQATIKIYIKDKAELQDSAVLTSLDNLLKVSSASEIPGALRFSSFDSTDYLDPKPATPPAPTVKPVKEPSPMFPASQPKWMNTPRFSALDPTPEPIPPAPLSESIPLEHNL